LTAPPAEDISYPFDFNDTGKSAVRKHARDYLNLHPHLAPKTTNRADIMEAVEDLKSTWPVTKGRFTSIVQVAFEEARNRYKDHAKRSRSASVVLERSFAGSEQEETADTDTAKDIEKRSRKRKVVEEDSEKEEGDQPVKIHRGADCGRRRGRGRERGQSITETPRATPRQARAEKRGNRKASPSKKG
jgi:hypothetical protein